MILVKIKSSLKQIIQIEVSGHAEYAEHGKDLVCAGVSCIMYGTYNALCELCQDGFDYKISDGFFRIDIINSSETAQIVMKTAIIQLETMHTSYAKYIKIKKMEV